MDNKEVLQRLYDFTMELNANIDRSYVSSEMIWKTSKTLLTRSVIDIYTEDDKKCIWIFENADVAAKIHTKLKDLLMAKEMMKFKQFLENEENKDKTKEKK